MSKPVQRDHTDAGRRAVLQAVACSAVALVLPRPLFASPQALLVETSGGKLRGADAGGVKVFRGVQYGASPSGKGRFKLASPAKWAGIKEALDYGNCAPQGSSLIRPAPRGAGISLEGDNPTFAEDCLYLNVWTPGLDSNKAPGTGLAARRRLRDWLGRLDPL